LEGVLQEIVMYNSDQDAAGNRTGIEGNVNAHFQIGNFGTPTSGLLATYTGAAAAYSVRQLANTAALSMRVRRDTAGGTGDDDEADVLFDFTLTDPTISLDSQINNASALVTATTLGQFLNVGTVNGTTYTNPDSLTVTASCYVDTWYDQAGSNDAEQATETSQPQIHDGTVNTDLITENGKPAIYSGTGVASLRTGTLTYSAALITMVLKRTSRKGVGDSLWTGTSSPFNQLYSTGTNWQYYSDGVYDTGLSLTSDQQLITVTDNGTSTTYYKNGSAGNTDTISNNITQAHDLFYQPAGSGYGTEGNFQEWIIWDSDQTSPTNNRPGIETDINDYFSIY